MGKFYYFVVFLKVYKKGEGIGSSLVNVFGVNEIFRVWEVNWYYSCVVLFRVK